MGVGRRDSGLREKILALQDAMFSLPQVELVTEHHFADGMYARVLHHPPGALVVGKIHKKEHFFILTSGQVFVTVNEEVQELNAPHVLVSSPNTKRALFSPNGCVYMTVHRTKKKNLEKIEKQIIEPEKSLFDSSNKLKGPLCLG